MGDQPDAKPLPTHRTTQNKRIQTSMPLVEFEPTTSVFEWVKTVHALDRAATVAGEIHIYLCLITDHVMKTLLSRGLVLCGLDLDTRRKDG
jgi:hypothetical protein